MRRAYAFRAVAAEYDWEAEHHVIYLDMVAAVEIPLSAQLAALDTPQDETKGLAVKLNLAAQYIKIGHFDEARAILAELERQRLKDEAAYNQVQFLLGLLDIQSRDYASAIRHFHKILVSEPQTVRVRLELGRAYFLNGDYYDAERQFRFARAGKLPPNVLANIDKFLSAIRSLKTFSYNFAIAIAPDTNLNAGPATDAVTLYGLPFQLSQSAKANSGVGLAVDTGAEWAPRLTKRIKLRIGAQLHRAQYRNTQFDDMTLSAYAGPHLTLKKWDFNLLGSAARRWYGDHAYSNAVGAGVDATYYVTTRLGISTALSLNHLDYPQNDQQSGSGGSIAVSAFYTPTTASVVRASVVLGRQNATNTVYAFHSQQLSLSYSREFKGGITLSLSPSFTRINYKAPMVAFNATRIDNQYTAQVAVLHRRLDWGGFTPRIIYTYTRNDSSIPLYSFNRNRVEFGVTRAF